MEVDHFDPTIHGRRRHFYRNLLPASRHCNGAKGDKWPSESDHEEGMRFLNPTEEMDYGEHIFEDPKTHELFASTPAGWWQIEKLDLNSPHLVRERADRARLSNLLDRSGFILQTRDSSIASSLAAILEEFKRQKERMIPPTPSSH